MQSAKREGLSKLYAAVLVIFGGFCGSMNDVFVHTCCQSMGNDIREGVFRRIMTFSFPQVDRFGTGSGEAISQGQLQLMSRKGRYYQLYMTQYAGFAT